MVIEIHTNKGGALFAIACNLACTAARIYNIKLQVLELSIMVKCVW